ncbi:3'-5' exoribonuclease YhaM [Lactobacillus nasalidis]|uniref:3'-5' exoribonuclease YhaM n=1 Tax=Lactobacillus nasalidis TaxID=2797258 RepID=A0ABQ3W641_9LACO|nr:HD domain-containing protein [Lactobacillus nasalidis]GHV98195.1 3'-5' exoribonuclease YhaM [Lactobacillus nasalidis]GHV98625.1 3'-5' exoribonuclease YhaM [Lactobacillus nasalidis]GHW02018.1 3'-5' exoribonuclease YhaM [Lactobacillus nasalidis]
MLKRLLDYNEGEEFDLVLIVKSSQLRQDKKGNHYLLMQLADSSGSIRANYWQASAEDANRFNAGTVVEASGMIEDYRNHDQIKLFSIHPVSPDEEVDLSQLVASAPASSQKMEKEIWAFVDKIANQHWHDLVTFLLKKWSQRFFAYPAGKSNHHAYKGGLAFHTLTMLKDARALADNYPAVNRSLLYAGCILHDMGKVLELSGPVATQYTAEGNLIGHLVLIDEQLMLAAQELGIDLASEDLLLLRHMVLSHHGRYEYGSPKLPALLEAELLHRIDDLDAAVNAITTELSTTKPGEFTPPLLSQDGRRYYRPRLEE